MLAIPHHDSGVQVRELVCPRQSELTCAFHAVANAERLRSTGGRSVISTLEGQQIEQHAVPQEHYMHSIGLCAGDQEITRYLQGGGIVVRDLELYSNPGFMSALNRVVSGVEKEFSLVVKFKTHAIAALISRDGQGSWTLTYADSDRPSSGIHPDTLNAISLIAKNVDQATRPSPTTHWYPWTTYYHGSY
jgi:hypothetical protein